MNISDVIGDMKERLGLETIALPFKQPTEIVLQNIIHTSVRTFSQFKPQIRDCYESIHNLRSPDEMSKALRIFLLPECLTITPVQYADAYIASSNLQNAEAATNSFTVGSPFVGFGSYYPQDIMNATQTGAAINKYAGVTSRPQSSEWLGYNKIKLHDFPADAMVYFVAKCDHDLSLETIPVSCRESFIQLAELDIKATLYNMLKNYNETGGAFNKTQLDISAWSGAEAERNALVEKWTGIFHLDDIETCIQFF